MVTVKEDRGIQGWSPDLGWASPQNHGWAYWLSTYSELPATRPPGLCQALGCMFCSRFKLVVPRRPENSEIAVGPWETMNSRVGGALEKGKRTRLRVPQGEKQETANQPGSSREGKQRLSHRALQGSEWREQENSGRGPRQKQREDTEAESTWDRVNERALSQKQEVRRSWVFWVFFFPCWIEPWL